MYTGITKRVRGTHSTCCKNPNPFYEVPESHKKRPMFIRDLVKSVKARDITATDEAMLGRRQTHREKHFYRDRNRAMNALAAVFCEHVNIVTWQVEISLRNASDSAGLSTISDAEQRKAQDDETYTPRVSISRASRAFKDMVDMGWIVARQTDQVWDAHAGAWIDKYYEVTELFFNACGITSEKLLRVQSQWLGYHKSKALAHGMSPAEVGRMSISQMKADRKVQWRRRAFERRRTDSARKKALRDLHGKNRAEQRQVAMRRVLDALSESDIRAMQPETFKALVNKEIAALRKFTHTSPPLH